MTQIAAMITNNTQSFTALQFNRRFMSNLEKQVIDLGKQRDQFEREYKAWRELAESRLKEIEELAAHVERLEDALRMMTKWENHVDPSERHQAIQVLNQSPQTSLAEVRAKQAEESFIDGCQAVVEEQNCPMPFNVQRRAEQHGNKICNGEDGKL